MTPETQRRFIRGFVICAALSVVSTWLGNLCLQRGLAGGRSRLQPDGELVSGSIVTLVIARLMGWAIDGALVGAGVGLATLTMDNVPKGAVGGLVGGAVGGIAFDLIGPIAGGGLASRFFGEAVIGLAIGLFIGLVQELTKAAWLTVEQGRLRGRQYRIEGARATIGRAEENPVGLFGDPAVQQRHAVIERRGADYVIRNLAVQDGTFVNGKRIETRRPARRRSHPHRRLRNDVPSARNVGACGHHASLAARRGESSACRRAAGGANARSTDRAWSMRRGSAFPVRAGTETSLGRALDNDIVVNHSSVSRHHASIENSNGGFVVRDLNSQNGTFVGSRRVTEPTLVNDGDPVRFGDAQFTFRG